MAWLRWFALSLVIGCIGCGSGKPEFALEWVQKKDAWPKRDQPGTGIFAVKMGKASDATWAGRKMKVVISTEPDITIDPKEQEVTLDATGTAQFDFKYSAAKTATKQTYTVNFTVTGPENFTSSLPGELYVSLRE